MCSIQTIQKRAMNIFFDEWGNFKISVVENSKQYMKSEAGCQSAYAPYAGFELQKIHFGFC